MYNVLFVSVAFPPKADAEGLQVAKYLKYLLRENDKKFEIDAVTSRHPTLNMSYDASLEESTNGVRQIVELAIYENKYTNYLLRKTMPWLVNTPDSKFSFHWQSSKATNNLKHKPSLIYSRSFPASSAVMAYKLKHRYNVPWIMHLSDIWADCPEIKYTGRSMEYQQTMERLCFESADVVCVTSNKTMEFYKKKYKNLDKRLEYFPNVFDIEDSVAREFECDHGVQESISIVHTGSLVGDRSPEPFLKAVTSLPSNIQKKFKITFVGPVDSRNRQVFDNYSCECISYFGEVNYQEALQYQRSADVLLLIDLPVDNPELRVFFPSKILDYIIANHPIMALIDKNSEAQHIIENSELGTCIERQDIQSIKDHMVWLLSAKNSGYFNKRAVPPEFDAALNAKRLVEMFDEYV